MKLDRNQMQNLVSSKPWVQLSYVDAQGKKSKPKVQLLDWDVSDKGDNFLRGYEPERSFRSYRLDRIEGYKSCEAPAGQSNRDRLLSALQLHKPIHISYHGEKREVLPEQVGQDRVLGRVDSDGDGSMTPMDKDNFRTFLLAEMDWTIPVR